MPGLRKSQQFRRAGSAAARNRGRESGGHTVAGKADRCLLRRGKASSASSTSGDSADHQSAVIAPAKAHPFGVSRTLVAKHHGRLERLIVIDPENSAARSALRDQEPPVFRREVARASVAEGPIAWKPCRFVVLTRPVTPSSFELCHAIGNVMVVFSSVLKS